VIRKFQGAFNALEDSSYLRRDRRFGEPNADASRDAQEQGRHTQEQNQSSQNAFASAHRITPLDDNVNCQSL
jgi:hypothetical protein